MIGRLLERAFRAMGTSCALAVTVRSLDERGAERALDAGLAEVESCERALSRFDPDSDLSRLNAAVGRLGRGRRTARSTRSSLALRAREDTGGRFDPTILPALVAAGYDRTFEELEERPARTANGWRAAADVELDPEHGRARVERGAAVDLGGIGKGFSAGRALFAMHWAWPELPGALVDLGGDVALAGRPPDGGSWRVAVADARTPGETLMTLAIEQGGVATSGRDRRRFGPGRSLHHLIDPSTGAPALAGPLAVTVVAPDPAEAEAHATALAVSTLEDARAHLARFPQLAALYVPEDGEPVALGALPALTGVGGVNAFLAHAPVAWYVARAAGLVAFGFLTLSVWLGTGDEYASAREHEAEDALRLAPDACMDGAVDARPYTPGRCCSTRRCTSASARCSSRSRRRGAPVRSPPGWSPVGLTLMLAASFRLRTVIGQKGWRRLHYASFAAFFLALGHALTSGTDLRGGGGPIVAALAAGPVIWLTFYRILMPRTPGSHARPRAPAQLPAGARAVDTG